MKKRTYWCEPSSTLIVGWQVMVACDDNPEASRFVAQCEEVEAKIIVDALNAAKLRKS